MKKVLISVPHDMHFGGVQNYVLSIVKNMDLSDLKIDIYFSQFNKSQEMFEEFKHQNTNIIFGNNIGNSKLGNLKILSKLMKKNQYDVIHINTGDLSYQVINLVLAKIYHIKKRISHSHNSVVPQYKNLKLLRKMKDLIYRFLIKTFSTDYFACSILAGNWMYGEKVFAKKGIVQYNGIEVEKFRFNQDIRNKIRNSLSIGNSTTVIGLTAYFNNQKNHSFLIDVFEQYHKKDSNSCLILVGDGELKEKIREKVEKLNLVNSVNFIGTSKTGYEYYNAMDCFVMTSIFEGLPFVGLEAQVSGLLCILSDSITTEVKFNDNVHFLDISKEPEYWADFILKKIKSINSIDRLTYYNKMNELLTKNGYNIKDSSEIIRKAYLG